MTLFDDWLDASRLPFFTDYTDHGIEHLSRVLATADLLISERGHALITAGDAAVLIAATLFHDAAMHVSEAGFHQLIRGTASKWRISGFDDRAWDELWDDFLFSARRWDERQLRRILGEGLSGAARVHVRDPFEDYDNLTDTDRRLIGEFIRRHHHRMAHEFAVHGIPGAAIVSLETTLPPDLRDLSGLVARSHGVPVRSCLDYLQRQFHRREYKGVHAVYLMTLLRISDNLQIHAERVPLRVFQYRHIPSRLSVIEHKTHYSITNITQTHDDPESIEIQARPLEIVTYLRVTEWLASIQTELDASWAVLGETYGAHDKLSGLGLILRRVRSNLDDVAEFSRTVSYVPERIELAVARPDLLKLLVGPLYDNVPSIGIRELAQNAIDAVREREFLQERHPELRQAPLASQAHDVEIRISEPDEHGNRVVTIRDRGVGMTVETIRDYFLTAGASFRNSDAWKREFDSDDAPNGRVLRSGRFGVGLLAGFLLGPRMEVSTRHIRETVGVRFSTALDMEPIELRHDRTIPVGTTIRIDVSNEVYRQLLTAPGRVALPNKFDWFVYDAPSVARFIGKRELAPNYAISRPGRQGSYFRRVRCDEDYAVYWIYHPFPALSVNGLFVSNAAGVSRFSADGRDRSREVEVTCRIRHPSICIEDPDAAFPINLRRSGIVEPEYSFEESLRTDIIDDFLAYLLVHCPDTPQRDRWSEIQLYPGLVLEDYAAHYDGLMQKHFLASTREGVMMLPLQPYGPLSGRAIRTLFLPAEDGNFDWHGPDDCLRARYTLGPRAYPSSEIERQVFFRKLDADKRIGFGLDFAADVPLVGGRGKRPSGLRLVVPSRFIRRLDSAINEPRSRLGRLRASIRSFCPVESTIGKHVILTSPGCPPVDLSIFEQAIARHDEICLVDVHPSTETQANPDRQLLADRWNKLIGLSVIPFDLSRRRRELRYAYEQLAPFIAIHESMKAKGVLC